MVLEEALEVGMTLQEREAGVERDALRAYGAQRLGLETDAPFGPAGPAVILTEQVREPDPLSRSILTDHVTALLPVPPDGDHEPGPTRDHQMDRRILALVQLGEQRARLVVHVGVRRRERAQHRLDRVVTEERMELQDRGGDMPLVPGELVWAKAGVVRTGLAWRHAHASEILGKLEIPPIERQRIHPDRARRARLYMAGCGAGKALARLTTQSTRR